MDRGSKPIILVDHQTLDSWIKAGLVTIHHVGEVKFNVEAAST